MLPIHAFILGIVEGITEFLPISSTAHLMLTAKLLGLAQSDFLKTFEIVIQFGAILAVVVVYARRLKLIRRTWPKILAAFIPTGIIGFILYKFIKQYLLGNDAIALWALGIGGLLLIIFELVRKEKIVYDVEAELESMSYTKAMCIGVAQALAIIPGVSRSAATIVAGRMLGLSRQAIIEFSFLLASPTMLAASGYDLYKSGGGLTNIELFYIAIGFVSAFISAYISIRWLLRYIKTHNFILFGFYRIIVALLFIPLI